MSLSGDTRGRFDAPRVQQLLRNLLSNAIKHGSLDMPVQVALRGDQAEVHLEVSNSGQVDSSQVQQMFDPLRRGSGEPSCPGVRKGWDWACSSCGRLPEPMAARDARCEAELTTFTVRLPRQESSASS
jgi:K+-sensing histidine kinase KdpD